MQRNCVVKLCRRSWSESLDLFAHSRTQHLLNDDDVELTSIQIDASYVWRLTRVQNPQLFMYLHRDEPISAQRNEAASQAADNCTLREPGFVID